jgi:hypothetical protein
MTNKKMWPYDYKSRINENTTSEELMWTINDCQVAQFSGYCDPEKREVYQEVIVYCFELYNAKK